jgi:DNA-binding HxlR family transcriptional regulator
MTLAPALQSLCDWGRKHTEGKAPRRSLAK